MMTTSTWLSSNCRFATFAPPQKGALIKIPGKTDPSDPGDYLLVESVETGKDQRGNAFWSINARGKDGRTIFLSSDQVPSWSNAKGLQEEQYHDWHKQDLQKKRDTKMMREQETLVAGFEEKYRFQDGSPLRSNQRKPLLVRVDEAAQGPLGLFAGTNMYIDRVDYASETVDLKPMDKELADDPSIMGEASGIPAADVARYSAPALREGFGNITQNTPNGTMSQAEIMKMTPGLNHMGLKGRVELSANIYENYQSGKGTGPQIFEAYMTEIGIDPEDAPARMNRTPQKYNLDGSKSNLFGPWQGTVRVGGPVDPRLLDEIYQVVPEGRVQKMADGSLLIHSNALYLNMLALGYGLN